ncbi:nucleoside-diphosphate-sugar epimerase [Bacteroidales bacterium 6E]|nr:nucleoside-diphosphate-sugar epimerase [Bacteroidales bacterium 6E]
MRILITGGAGFIGSNLVDYFLERGHQVVCLDNFATGKRENLTEALKHPGFTLMEGDIRNADDCRRAVEGCEYVLHQAALGSVPRSIKDPVTTNEVNVGGFVNMLVAARDAGVKRFVYAASSSTYGDSETLPKVEEVIGNPLSPYAISKYVNELYAHVFARVYGMECVGLRYFNVFGKRQDPFGAYAAVIPLWVKQMINLERPVINGQGEYSRDFTYVANVIEANAKAMLANSGNLVNKDGFRSQVFNVAYGGNTTLNALFDTLKGNLSRFNPAIATLEPQYGPYRSGDIPHSLASIEKARQLLGYNPQYSAEKGFELACEWYWQNLK